VKRPNDSALPERLTAKTDHPVGPVRRSPMLKRRIAVTAITVIVASLGFVSSAAARSYVDPTTLTPPLKPFRVCWQLGPTVQCDTSGEDSYENVDTDVLPCGQLYESAHGTSNSTRYYENGLLVRRAVQEEYRGSWSLSPTGAGPTVEYAENDSWDDHFAIPGDINSFVRTVRGSLIRVPALGSSFHASGVFVEDGIADGPIESHGLWTLDDASVVALCALLVP
jgi:hypothetical protein